MPGSTNRQTTVGELFERSEANKLELESAARHKVAAPSDAACGKAWEKIMAIATEHCLIAQAYGGVATLAIPSEQRKAFIRGRVLNTHCRAETKEIGK